ncbi:Putative regulatory subunit OS=Gemmata sp. Wa1-1 PE=4 SV=1 [Gemmata massiliana]|uniref:Leucine Rich repeats (2 copies) n=1 Tax=Gemmata massiliana TaxID=1210884 RepID=A0A6P2CY64_9BACT|nr:hypothetical protein [Gemmata massiliana]VTR93326.1 Putative regulatory subunit OS=Gemmata sp. Wa1-1 PE=4 SV=1 [Gemmata massiliana]
MSRSVLCGIVSLAVLVAPGPARADEPESPAVKLVKGWGGMVIPVADRDGKEALVVNLFQVKAEDIDLKKLAQFADVKGLELSGVKLNDEMMKDLIGIKRLTRLCMMHTEVTGARLKELTALENLDTLYLVHCPVTDDGLTLLR